MPRPKTFTLIPNKTAGSSMVIIGCLLLAALSYKWIKLRPAARITFYASCWIQLGSRKRRSNAVLTLQIMDKHGRRTRGRPVVPGATALVRIASPYSHRLHVNVVSLAVRCRLEGGVLLGLLDSPRSTTMARSRTVHSTGKHRQQRGVSTPVWVFQREMDSDRRVSQMAAKAGFKLARHVELSTAMVARFDRHHSINSNCRAPRASSSQDSTPHHLGALSCCHHRLAQSVQTQTVHHG